MPTHDPGSISSRQNPWFRRLQRAMERHEGEIVIEGRKAIADAIRLGWAPIVVAARDDATVDLPAATVIRLRKPLFNALSETATSQGVLALFPRPAQASENVFRDHERIVIALDGVQDPGNVGTIIRLAASFDAAGVVLLEGCADPWSPKAIRASAGTVLGVQIATMRTDELLAEARERNLGLFASVAHGDDADRIPSGRAIVVLGSEGRGISSAILEQASPISIRMSAAVDSLNVAMAAAIILSKVYEARVR